jgi:YbbR domain-containing protein
VIEVPVRTVGLATGLSANVLPANAVVSLSGPQPVLEDLSNGENVIVSVDLTGLRVGNHQVEPEVEIVSGVIPAEDLQKVIIESLLPTVIEVEITAGSGTDTR